LVGWSQVSDYFAAKTVKLSSLGRSRYKSAVTINSAAASALDHDTVDRD